MGARISPPGLARAASVLLALPLLAVASSALALCPPYLVQNFDEMRAPLLPTDWVASQGVNVTGAPLWVTTRVTPHTVPNDSFSTAPDNILDNRLDTPELPTGPFSFQVVFENNYNLESGSDGAVLEVSHPSVNGGAFTDITDPAVGGSVFPPYDALITSASSPIAGRMAWTGNSGGYLHTVVNLGNAASPPGHCKVRFRLVTDNSGASAGWRIDTFSVPSFECPPPPTPTATPTAAPTVTPIASPCGSPNVIADSTFEAGTPWSNWTVQTSTNFGTPLCNRAVCGSDGGSPYAGDNWAWFGGASVPETATLGQNVTILTGGPATLSFVMKIRDLDFPPATDVLNVRVDGTLVQSYPEAGQFEGDYSLRTIDLGAFADGGSHLILFEYVAPTAETSTYLVDNIFLTFGPECSSPTPTPTPTPTATPSATATPSPTPTPPPTPSPTATPLPTPAQALNISTRLRVETGASVAIGGFIITGTESKRVALRGIGPSLGSSGLSDVLADPTLELRGSDGTLLLQNDNWQDDPFGGGGAEFVALGLAPQNPNESGIVATLEPGVYTAILAGKNQTSGLGLVEIYDVDTAADSQLANLSTRGFVRTGDNVMIGGFILGQGSANVDVAVRGIGPSLGQAGLADVLLDPTLELHDGNGALLIANDNWQDDPVSAAQLAGHGLAPSNSLESGIFITLQPGLFTAILAGKNGGVGLGLVEIYSGLDGNTLTVTSTADSGPGSLRDAIAVAGDGGTIQFAPALNGQTISLTSGELLIDKSITIRGPAIVERSPADGTPAFRIFHITPGHTVTMHGLTISNGFADMNNPSGGGVFNDQSTLTLSNCAVEYNRSAVGSGGGVCNSGSSAILTVVDSTITGNFMEVAGSFLCCGGGFGAGIYSNGTLAIDHSTVSGNQTGYIQNTFSGDGGGIYSSGGAVISNSSVSGNFANRVAGGIFNQGTLEIANSAINFNQVIFSGGGVYNGGTLAIDNSTFSGNRTATLPPQGQGGGIKNTSSATISRSTFSENVADGDGGGIFNSGAIQIGNTILKASSTGGGNIFSDGGASTVTSLGYNLSSDNGSGFLTATGDQINTDPILGPLQDNGGPTFTRELLTGSPAINAGDPNFTPPPLYDQRGPGYDRVVGGRIDIGSFEVQP
jgi:hypothetical protein